jgi:putative FmdB family regulatory protein
VPIYEYRCQACEQVSSILVRSAKTATAPKCQHCGSKRLKRLISRLSRVRNEQQVMDDLGTPRPGGQIDDPRQIGRWVEQRFEEYGIDVPNETREMIDAARDGELPDPVRDL